MAKPKAKPGFQPKNPAAYKVSHKAVKPGTWATGFNSTGSTSQQAAQAPAAPPAQQTPTAPANPPPGPVNPYAVSSYNPASGNPDPRDATYFANLAKLQATTQQNVAGSQLEQTNADVNYNTQLGTMATDRQRNIRNLAESMIGKGLLRSGYHDRGQTEATSDYLTAVSGVQTAKSQADTQRQATMSAILSNLGIDEQGLYADASGRYADQQAQAAQNQTPTATVAYPTEPSPSAPPSKKPKRRVRGSG